MLARLKSSEELINEGWVVDEFDHDMLIPPYNIQPSNYKYNIDMDACAGNVIDIYQHEACGKIEVYKWYYNTYNKFIWTIDMVEIIEDEFNAEDISIIV